MKYLKLSSIVELKKLVGLDIINIILEYHEDIYFINKKINDLKKTIRQYELLISSSNKRIIYYRNELNEITNK